MTELLRWMLNLPVEASTYAPAVDVLHFFVIGATMLGASFVFLLALFFLIRYRRSSPFPLTAAVSTSVPTEILIIGSILALFLAFWVVGATQYAQLMTPPPDAMPVYVTGKQWMWKFGYADGREAINELTVPVGRPIKLVMTSRDVIHSFYVPAFRMKHDVVPGRYYTAWFEATMTGVFDIDCAELCGVSHSKMIGKVRVLSAEDYQRWLRTEAPPNPDLSSANLADEGRAVAARRGCFNCHTIDGQSHIGPTWAGLYGSVEKLADGSTVTADDEYLTRSMMEPEVQIVAGYKPVMPTYQGALPEPEVAALVEFIKSLRDRPYAPSMSLPKVNPLGSAQPQVPAP
jgi:cytochrome c oxidase subunit 2